MNGALESLASWSLQNSAGTVTGVLITAKVTALFIVATVLLLTMRRASASSRHHLIGLVLAGSLALPLIAFTLPAWEVISLPVEQAAALTRDPAAVPSATPNSARSAADLGPLPSSPSPGTRPVDSPRGAELFQASVTKYFGLIPTVTAVWAAVATLLLLLIVVRALAMQFKVRRATPIDDDSWLALLEDCKRRLGLSQSVELRRSDAGQMPLVWGARRPVVLLPDECDAWPVDRRRAVLAHELAHVVRRDIPVLLVGKAACALHWFNPLAWWLGRRLSAERERACDDAALGQGMRAKVYAEQLLQVAVTCGNSNNLAPLMAAPSELEGRILAILDTDRNRRGASRATRIALAAALVLALIPVAVVTATATVTPTLASNDAVRHGHSDVAEFKRQLESRGMSHADFDSMVKGLTDPSASIRGASAWRLGELGDVRAVEPLITATRDSDDLVREWAVRALGELERTRAVPALIDRLDDANGDVREWAARSLGEIGDPRAIQPLIDSLDDPISDVREWAIRSLADFSDPRLREPLEAMLADPSDDVREWAVRSLAGSSDPRVRESLEGMLADPSDDVREWAVRSLAGSSDPRNVKPMIEMLKDQHPDVREAAAKSLGELRDREAIQPLIDSLDDPSSDVREWAARALGDYGEPAHHGEWNRETPEPLMPGLQYRNVPREAGDSRAIDALIRSLDAQEASEREWAIRSLGNLDDGRSVTHIIERLDDTDREVREWASRALGQIGDARAILPLIDSLQDDDAQVREWSARSLGLLQDRRMVEPLAGPARRPELPGS